jgi:hypothetical protein
MILGKFRIGPSFIEIGTEVKDRSGGLVGELDDAVFGDHFAVDDEAADFFEQRRRRCHGACDDQCHERSLHPS